MPFIPIIKEKYTTSDGAELLPERKFNQRNYTNLVESIRFIPFLFTQLSKSFKMFGDATSRSVKKPNKVELVKYIEVFNDGSIFDYSSVFVNASYFPLTMLRFNKGEEEVFYALTNLYLGIPGSFGRVKVAFEIKREGDIFKLSTDQPIAIKINHDQSCDLAVNAFAQQQHSDYYGEVFAAQRIKSRYTDDGFKYLDKTYSTMPILPGIELFEFSKQYLSVKTEEFKVPKGEKIIADQCNLAERLQICLALAQELIKSFLSKDIIHSDIKSENVFVSRLGPQQSFQVKFLDIDELFRIGTLLPDNYTTTMKYLPPEYCRKYSIGRYIIAAASNIYSLAVLFTEIMGWDLTFERRKELKRIQKLSQYKKHPLKYMAEAADRFPLQFKLSDSEPSIFEITPYYEERLRNIVNSLIALIQKMSDKEPEKRVNIQQVLVEIENLYLQARILYPMNSCKYIDTPPVTAQSIEAKFNAAVDDPLTSGLAT